MPHKDPVAKRAYFRAYYLKHRTKIVAAYKKKRKEILAYVKKWRLAHLDERRAYGRKKSREEKSLARVRLWHRHNRRRARLNGAKWDAENKHKKRTHSAVYAALKKGTLKRKPCAVCGAAKVEAHHEDYSKPLKVKWLCKKHHMEAHRKYA